MKKTIIASLIGLLSANSYAENKILSTDDVVITAARVPQSITNVIGDVTTIGRDEIQRAGQSTLIELLSTQPGVEISSNGGTGKTTSLFLRGTNPNQIVVLIDGIRTGSATSGTTTFENIPLSQIERIEILRGPASSLYGQDAIGGVIQIFTKRGEGSPIFYGSVGYGTYNTKTANVGFSGAVGDTRFSLNASAYRTDGFSSFRTNIGKEADKDGYRNLAVSGSLSHMIATGHEIGVQLLTSKGSSDYDSGNNTFNDYVDMTQLNYSIFSKNQFTDYWKSTVQLGEGIDDSFNYSAPNMASQFKTKQAQFSWQNDLSLPFGTLTLLYDRLEQRVVSSSKFDKTRRINDGFTGSYLLDFGPHSFQASIRSDQNSQFGNHNTGNIGYGISFTPNWRATASYGTAFKAPTFNDAFFPFEDFGPVFGTYQGNPNLKPEKSRNKEASIAYENEKQKLSATVYNNEIKDLILISQGIFNDSPINLGSVTINGLTLAGSQQWQNWQAKASVDIQSPRDNETHKLLIRRANRHASFNLNYQLNAWRFGTELIASSSRFNDADNQIRLAGYSILNFIADYKINADWSLQGRLNNALDKDYVLATTAASFNPTGPDYNTPGSNLFVSLRYSPNQ